MILQSDPAWATARLGHVTASRISDMLAKTKTGWGASRANYAAELVAERLTGAPAERFTNAAMQWGVDTEAHARAAYEFHSDVSTGASGFVKHPTIEWAGASPDGFVAGDGLWVQELHQLDPRQIAVSWRPRNLFWSPDSAAVAFVSESKLWKVPVSGGEPIALAAIQSTGAGWRAGCRSQVCITPAMWGEARTVAGERSVATEAGNGA